MDGEIKCIYQDRGFGFIRIDKREDVFFHVRDSYIPDDEFDQRLKFRRVEFEIEADDNGKKRAVKVRPL